MSKGDRNENGRCKQRKTQKRNTVREARDD